MRSRTLNRDCAHRVNISFVNQPWNACPPAGAGSISLWTYELSRRLASDNEVLVYARTDPSQPDRERLSGCQFRRISTNFDQKLQRFAKRVCRNRLSWPGFADAAFYFAYLNRIGNDMRDFDAEIIHVHNLSQFLPHLKRAKPRARLVLHMHCDWLTQMPEKLVRRRLQAASAVVSVSAKMTASIADRFRDLDLHFFTVANGVDITPPAEFRHSEDRDSDDFIFLFVGRISPEKGLHDFIDAFSLVLKRFPHCRLRIIGPESSTPRQYLVDLSDDPHVRALGQFYSGRYLDTLRSRMSAEVGRRVEFLGPIAHSDLKEEYGNADALVNPSLSESFGMPIVEAMERGLPVIATSVGGIPEVARDGETAILVEPANPSSLADAMQRLVQSEALRSRLGGAGRERAEKCYSWDSVATSLSSAYRKVIL